MILAALIEGEGAGFLSVARRHSRFPDDAPEALQRACVRFIERFEEPYDPGGWLATTIKREAWGLAQRAYRRRELSISGPMPESDQRLPIEAQLLDGDADPDERAEAALRHHARRREIERLKPDERTALLMLGLGCAYAEIGRRRH